MRAQKRRELAFDDVPARRLLPTAVDGYREETLSALAARSVFATRIAGFGFQRNILIETHYSNSN
jgi:hypothetical protein